MVCKLTLLLKELFHNIVRKHTLINNHRVSSLYERLEILQNENLKLRADITSCEHTISNLENEKQKLIKESIHYISPLPKLGDPLQIHQYNRAKKQCLILGYYGASNYGDELMLDVLLKEIQKPDVEITVLFAACPRYSFSQWKDIYPCYPPDSLESLEDIAEFYDEIILGGGAHIDDTECTDLGFIPYLATELSFLAIQKNKVVRWVAVSSNKELKRTDFIKK